MCGVQQRQQKFEEGIKSLSDPLPISSCLVKSSTAHLYLTETTNKQTKNLKPEQKCFD